MNIEYNNTIEFINNRNRSLFEEIENLTTRDYEMNEIRNNSNNNNINNIVNNNLISSQLKFI